MNLARLLVGLVLACGVLTAAPAAQAGIPVPEDDPFYDVPADIDGYQPGDVLGSRSIPAKIYELPVPAKAWQVKYATEDSHGEPSATVTTILVPTAAWTGGGPRPLVSYQVAEDGVAGKCAPSYALRAGVSGGASNSYAETGLILLALRQGWAVSLPDYEGPDSEFLIADTAAKGVLDGIRAARRFKPAGLGSAPVALWGYSGGSHASASAAQLQPSYAPDVLLAGVALGGLVGDIRSTINAFSGSAVGGAVAMGINGFLRAYPDLHLEQYLSAAGRAKVAAASGDCINDAVARYPFLRMADLEATPDALSAAVVAEMLRANSPLYSAGAPAAPVYHYHAILDELAPIAPARATMRRYCAAGTPVQSVEKLLGEHLTEIVLGAPGAVAFLRQRFAGKPVVNQCARLLH